MNKHIFYFLMLLASTGVCAQQNLDSLYAVWQDVALSDSMRVETYKNYIAKGFLYSKPDSAFVLSESLIRFAKKQGYAKAEALGYNLQGVAQEIQGNYTTALEYYEKSMVVCKETGRMKGVASVLNNMGMVYARQGNHPLALEYYEESLKVQKELGNKKGIAAVVNNIASIYKNQGNYIRALDYYKEALVIDEGMGNNRAIAIVLSNIGSIYQIQGNYTRSLEYFEESLAIREEIGNKQGVAFNLTDIGSIYKNQGNYQRALEYFEESLAIKKEIGNKQGIPIALGNIGSIYKIQGNYVRALDYYKEALVINEEIGDNHAMAQILTNTGDIYKNQGNYTQALKYCKRSLSLSEKLEQLPSQKEACLCLYSNYKAIGNNQKALQYHEQMLVLNDSLKLQETSKKLQQMEFAKQVLADSLMQVEKDLQVEMTHQAEVRTKDRNRNLAIGAGIFFLVLSGGYYSRWRYVKKSKQVIEKEKDRSENLLLNILPSEIAEELKLKGSVEAQDFDQVSVLFTDFKGFTTRSEKLTARELVSEINHCFKAFDQICEKYRIEKIKTIGDAYMAGGGLPAPNDNAVKNTVLAAIEMQAFMTDRIAEKKNNNEVPFEMRLGIHTGPVVAGIVGVKKFQYDIWGDTVNTASRMESSGEIGKVNISEDTYKIIKDDPQFSFVSRGKIQAKGKGEINMYFVSLKEAA